jgi:hypothetical protein
MKGQLTNGRSTLKYYVLNPIGIRPTVDRFPLSPRLSSLKGKTVYFVESLHASVFMEELAKRLPKYAPGVKTVFRRKPLGPMTDNPETWDEVVKKAHAMVSGTVMGASSGAFGVGWTVGIEKHGIPTVLIVGKPFDEYYIPLSKEMFGMPALRCLNMALVPEHEIADITEAQYKEVLTKIIDGLTKPLTAEEKKAGKIVPKKQSRIAMTGTLEEVQDYFLKQRWTDGLPIVPPTEEKVKEMLKGTSHAPDEVIKTEYQEQVSINTYTVEKVAIVGVMAGCKPEYMPVLLAIAEALGPSSASQVSPSSMSLMTVVNGPIRNEIGMNRGLGATGPGNQANATIGRFVRLGLIALAGLVPGYNDMTGMGNPTRYIYCFPENEEDSPWKPFHVSMGRKPKESTVSIFSGGWSYGTLISTASPDAILERITKARNGSTFLMSPGTAGLYAKKGMSKEDVEKYIWEHALDPVSERKKLMWGTMRSDMYDKMSDDDLVPVYERDAIKIIIAGAECGITTTQVWNYFRPSMASVDKWR